MASKALLVLGVLLVVLLALSSEVAAKEQEKTQTAGESVDTVDKHGYGHGHGGYGHGHDGYGHGHGGHGHGHGCKYGCCGGYGGSCKRCCSYAGEVPDAETEAKPQN